VGGFERAYEIGDRTERLSSCAQVERVGQSLFQLRDRLENLALRLAQRESTGRLAQGAGHETEEYGLRGDAAIDVCALGEQLVDLEAGKGTEQPLQIVQIFLRAAHHQRRRLLLEQLPRWIAANLFAAFVTAGVYGCIRSVFKGPGWKKGLKFGEMVSLLTVPLYLGLSGVFNLPDKIWMWWSIELPAYHLAAGAVLGWLAQKLVPEEAPPPEETLVSA
jgi:hypothetical protein